MTTAWLITAIVVVSMLFGAVIMYAIFQTVKNARIEAQMRTENARLEGRIQGIGAQLRNVPKRRSDRKLINHED